MGCWMRFVACVIFIFHLRIYFVAYLMSLSVCKISMLCIPFPKTEALVFTYQQKNSSENTVGKGEIARDKQFSFFHSVF